MTRSVISSCHVDAPSPSARCAPGWRSPTRNSSRQPGFEYSGARNDDRPEPGEPLGPFVPARESDLDFEPGHRYVHALSGDRQHRRLPPPSFTVNIPAHGSPGPTGQVANGRHRASTSDTGGNGKPANFIFANLNGSISAWNGDPTLTQAFTQTSVAGASFTGLAINQADTDAVRRQRRRDRQHRRVQQ